MSNKYSGRRHFICSEGECFDGTSVLLEVDFDNSSLKSAIDQMADYHQIKIPESDFEGRFDACLQLIAHAIYSFLATEMFQPKNYSKTIRDYVGSLEGFPYLDGTEGIKVASYEFDIVIEPKDICVQDW